MSGDYSRKTFDPKRDFSGVLMQQGRVQLDADWNEMIGILSRRWRAETTDIIGRSTVPQATPDGFKIAIAADGTLSIGIGRIYVDGLLAENHGLAPLEFDPVLAEQRGTQAVPFNQQPYFPNVANIAPAPGEGGPYLIYLDVWTREVTYLENRDLIEKAVGVDTAARLQTVWQVRVLGNIGPNVTCATPDDQVPGWSEVIKPSDARLSTAAVGVATDTDPCVIPPTGGYRGLENRLYRVEIHDGGIAGKATFKWSRDNASIATSLTAITALDKITVARIGRDNTLRFKVGDWIEITDDWREFAQQPGLMRQIKDVQDATQIITLTSPLPAGIFPDDGQGNLDATRHTRIKKWDQSGRVADTNGNLLADLDAAGSSGLIPVPPSGTSIVLEDGVQITFNTDAMGIYHVADYWSFAARTADASVETLAGAPPQGIHHHFSRLAILNFPTVTDCRNLWPPNFGGGDECCECSVCVTAESHNGGTLTIQKAIDQVKTTGGTVCLGVGNYFLREGVNIAGAKSLCVRGQGSLTVLAHVGAGSAILIDGSVDVTLEKFSLLAAARTQGNRAIIAAHNTSALTIQRCGISSVGTSDFAVTAIGLSGVLVDVLLQQNILRAPIGIGRAASVSATGKTNASAANAIALLVADLVVRDNLLECSQRGISFDATSIHAFSTRLEDNLIMACTQAGIVTLGWVAAAASLVISGNEIHTAGAGVIIGTDDTRVEGNQIVPTQAGQGTNGILITLGFDKTGLDRCQILNNRMVGLAGNGIHFAGGIVRSAMIKNNYIEAAGAGGIFMDDKSSGIQLTMENNHLLNIAPLANDAKGMVIGLRVVNTQRAEIVSNVLAGVGPVAAQSLHRAGIQTVNVASARIKSNQVLNLGPAGDFLQDAVGIECLGTFARLDLTNNIVRRNEVSPDLAGTSNWFAVRIGSALTKNFLAVNGGLSFALAGNIFYTFIGGRFSAQPRGQEIIGMTGNLLEGYGLAPVVSVNAAGAWIFSGNRCLSSPVAQTNVTVPVVRAQIGAALASTNYLQGTVKLPAMALEILPPNGAFTLLGNISSGMITVNGSALATTVWGPLNVVAP